MVPGQGILLQALPGTRLPQLRHWLLIPVVLGLTFPRVLKLLPLLPLLSCDDNTGLAALQAQVQVPVNYLDDLCKLLIEPFFFSSQLH